MANSKDSYWRNNPIDFARDILGVPLHGGQVKWVQNANKKINILRPGNRWGKTFVAALMHVWQLSTKIQMEGMFDTPEEWFETRYETLNFALDYEQAREVGLTIVDLVEGNVTIPKNRQNKYGKKNESRLKGWFITENKVDSNNLPSIEFFNNSRFLIRSYNNMGSAFKTKKLAFITGDECADIPELWTFTNRTLLPRVMDMKGIIHFVGTPQPEGYDYQTMIEMAEEEMESEDNAGWYTQKGSVYENEFLDKDEMRLTENIADPEMKRQIIDGEYVESGNKYFGYKRIINAVDSKLGLLKKGLDGRKYLTSVDFAGGKTKQADYTVIMVIDYTEAPYTIRYFDRIKGDSMPIPMQYSHIADIHHDFGDQKLIIDGTSLGGKNAAAFLKPLHPIVIDIGGENKAAMLTATKAAFDGRDIDDKATEFCRMIDEEGNDLNDNWGLIRFPNIPSLIKEFQNYKLDDKRIHNDCVMTLSQAVWWIMLRRPRKEHKGMMEVDWAASI